MDYEATARQLTPVQFELLVRAYVRQQAERVTSREKTMQFGFNCYVDTSGVMTEARWAVCFNYGPDTKGEILEPVVTEAARRQGWDTSAVAKLHQIVDETGKSC